MQGRANQYPAQRYILPCEEEAKVVNKEAQPLYEIAAIEIAKITVGIQQLRADPHDDALAELAIDIQAHGLLQPIGVAPATAASGEFQLLFGSRRLAAHLILKRTHITARVFREAGLDVRAVAMRENLHREQMTLSEECDAVAHFHHEQGLSVEQIASSMSVGRSWVLRRLALPGLPVTLKTAVLEGRLAVGAAERIALLPDADAQGYACNTTINCGLTVAQVNDLCKALEASQPPPTSDGPAAVHAQQQAALAAILCGTCALCNARKPIEEFQMLRVCLTDCASIDAAAPAPQAAAGGAGSTHPAPPITPHPAQPGDADRG